MSDTDREAGLREGIERLSSVLEMVRSELGDADPDHNWQGLSKRLAEGAEETKLFAKEVAGNGRQVDDVLFRLFAVRQSEISLSILSKVLDRIDKLERRIESLETDSRQ